MNVFGVGPLELIVVLVVALIFVGPERLPRLAADLARTIREVRKYTNSLASEFNDVIADIEKETANERSEWREIGRGLGAATESVTGAIRAARDDAERPLDQQPAEPAPNGNAAAAAPAPDVSEEPDNASPGDDEAAAAVTGSEGPP